MKFLISANSPKAPTGYGVQTALLADRLTLDGHTVAVACNYGQQIGMGVWRTPGGHDVRLYWEGSTATSADILCAHAEHFFAGDRDAGWIIVLNDMWAVDEPQLADWNVIAWTPVDHLTVPPGVAKFFHQTHATPVAMSRHGERAMINAGLDPVYIPLAVDTDVYKPTFTLTLEGVTHASRDYFTMPRDRFVVGMVAMNKGWVFDRKGFSEAIAAFGVFHHNHPDTILWLHTKPAGFDGINLKGLCRAAGIDDDAVMYTNQYAHSHGFTPEMMAALYTSFDVLLAPSHGEGFCVPMIESQACGTPVIVSDATAQTELLGAGWLVDGQPVWDNSQGCAAFMPSIDSIVQQLEHAYTADWAALSAEAVEFAQGYTADRVYDTYWRPFLATLAPPVNDPRPLMTDVAVLCPVMQRPQNVPLLVESFRKSNDGTATLYFIADGDDTAELDAIGPYLDDDVRVLISDRGRTFAQKLNVGYKATSESFVFVVGDDCEFTPGWLEAARQVSDRFDVIGTNDAPEGETLNLDVAAGRHADHFFVRRDYINDSGACLEGPGELAPEAFNHFYTDKEMIGLARARAVFTPCLTSRVIHHRIVSQETADGDVAYQRAAEYAEADRTQFLRRIPLIESQRVARGR